MNRQIKQGVCTAALLLFGALLAPFTASDVGDVVLAERAAARGNGAVYTVILCYDSDGDYGLFYEDIGFRLNDLYMEYQVAGREVVRKDGIHIYATAVDATVGTPYWFRVHATQFGSILGFSRVNGSGNYARFTVPVLASSLGLTNGPSKEPYGGTPPGGHGTVMSGYDNTFLADSKLVPSTAIPVMLIPDGSSRTPKFTAEYLVGNASHDTVGIETMSFPTGWFQVDGAWFVVWGYEESPAPFIVYVPEHLPLGGIRGTLELTGYSSDSVEWVAEDLYGVRWIPLLSSIPGSVDSPSPSQILDLNTLGVLEGAFILEPAIREKLLGQSELFTNLKAASDLNQDGVLDAADFVPLQAGE